MDEFHRIKRLPPYVFNIVNDLKAAALAAGDDIIDFGMGNPDQPTPAHIVASLVAATNHAGVNRYSVSRGILSLREAITAWYQRRYAVKLDPETEAIVTIGSKEGLSHLALAMTEPGDTVLVPAPAYPIHTYGFVIAGANVQQVPLQNEIDFFNSLEKAITTAAPKPKVLVLNFPANPSTHCVELDFFTKVVALAKRHKIWIIHDFAYADITFDGYKPPSILQVPGAKDIAVETYSLSKTYNMPGWRIGFVCGNAEIISALARIKSYSDYGTFTPIQIAAATALNGPQDCVTEICEMYRLRRDVLCQGLCGIGWDVATPKATMFVWAQIPTAYRHLGSLEFSKILLREAKVAVSPGVGFGAAGDEYVRFSLVENQTRILQAVRAIEDFLHTQYESPLIPAMITAHR